MGRAAGAAGDGPGSMGTGSTGRAAGRLEPGAWRTHWRRTGRAANQSDIRTSRERLEADRIDRSREHCHAPRLPGGERLDADARTHGRRKPWRGSTGSGPAGDARRGSTGGRGETGRRWSREHGERGWRAGPGEPGAWRSQSDLEHGEPGAFQVPAELDPGAWGARALSTKRGQIGSPLETTGSRGERRARYSTVFGNPHGAPDQMRLLLDIPRCSVQAKVLISI